MQGVDETSSQVSLTKRLAEAGDHSVRGGNAQSRACALYTHHAQQQHFPSAGGQYENGGAVRGSNAAAAALGLLQVGPL